MSSRKDGMAALVKHGGNCSQFKYQNSIWTWNHHLISIIITWRYPPTRTSEASRAVRRPAPGALRPMPPSSHRRSWWSAGDLLQAFGDGQDMDDTDEDADTDWPRPRLSLQITSSQLWCHLTNHFTICDEWCFYKRHNDYDSFRSYKLHDTQTRALELAFLWKDWSGRRAWMVMCPSSTQQLASWSQHGCERSHLTMKGR